MEPSVEERFAKIVGQMANDLQQVEIENAKLKSELNRLKFRIVMADCARCGEYKLLPWEDDDLGKICATCLHDHTLEVNI